MEKEQAKKLLRMNNFHGAIHLLAYCLMPNHFHLLIHQKNERALDEFMQSFMTRYTQYFNKRYKRIGPIYQGRYKAAMIETDEHRKLCGSRQQRLLSRYRNMLLQYLPLRLLLHTTDSREDDRRGHTWIYRYFL